MSAMHDGVRFDAKRHRGLGHVESYFLKINDAVGERALWLKATILQPLGKSTVAESWAIAFERGKPAVASKSTFPFERARFAARSLDIELPDLTLSRAQARATMEDIRVNLALEDADAAFVHYPHPRMYTAPFPSTKLHTPMPDLRARGVIEVKGRTWDVDGWRGELGHNWGRGHAFAYAWGHCNVWNEKDDHGVVFEGTSARVRVGPALLPTATLLMVRHRGVTHAITRFRQIFVSRGSMTFRQWQFSGRGPTLSVRGEMWAETEDMVGLHYENPSGAMTYCLNSKLASAELELELPSRERLKLTSRAAALELGTRDSQHGVPMVL